MTFASMDEEGHSIGEFDFPLVEGQRDLDLEIDNLAAIASAENDVLAETYQDDVRAERLSVEGIVSDDEPVPSVAGAPDDLDLITDNGSRQPSEMASVPMASHIPGYNRFSQVNLH